MKKIHIYTKPEFLSDINKIIATEDRLYELITVSTAEYTKEYDYSIVVKDNVIETFPHWDSTKPPVLLPEKIAYNKNKLLGTIFYLLGNYEKAYFYFIDNDILKLYAEISLVLLLGEEIILSSLKELTEQPHINHTALHNLAVAYHYGNFDVDIEEISNFYVEALACENTTSERLSYTAKQYATFLADGNLYSQAISVLERFRGDELLLSPQVKTNILAFISHLGIKLLYPPYDQSLIKKLKSDLHQCIKQLKKQDQPIDEAFVLMDASYLAMVSQSYSEALSYIQKAINLFEDGKVDELAANARLQKADLLFTWAQQGNPQFYRAAMLACSEALEIFKRELAPDIFADIHHKLGIIYSEILDDEKKRGIWASVSISSFKEALNYFNREDFPYEYALICNNQGNAYTKYPKAGHSDNYAKALDWYNQSLEIRTADKFLNERAITLLNYIEAAWNVNIGYDFNDILFNDMMSKAEEVKHLNVSEEFIMEADRHIRQLQELATNIDLL